MEIDYVRLRRTIAGGIMLALVYVCLIVAIFGLCLFILTTLLSDF